MDYVKTFILSAKPVLKKHGPSILTGLGVVGMFGAIVSAIKATPKAEKKIEEAKETQNVEKLTVKQTVKATWKCYILTAVLGTASAACVIGSNKMSSGICAASAAVADIAKQSLKDYKEEARKELGDGKANDIQDRVDKKRVENNPPPANLDILMAKGHGPTLCYDSTFGRYFYSDIEKIRQDIKKLNDRMKNGSEDYISLNEFFFEVGMDPIDIGDRLGWSNDSQNNDSRDPLRVTFSSQLANGRIPCLVMTYDVLPKYGYC